MREKSAHFFIIHWAPFLTMLVLRTVTKKYLPYVKKRSVWVCASIWMSFLFLSLSFFLSFFFLFARIVPNNYSLMKERERERERERLHTYIHSYFLSLRKVLEKKSSPVV